MRKIQVIEATIKPKREVIGSNIAIPIDDFINSSSPSVAIYTLRYLIRAWNTPKPLTDRINEIIRNLNHEKETGRQIQNQTKLVIHNSGEDADGITKMQIYDEPTGGEDNSSGI